MKTVGTQRYRFLSAHLAGRAVDVAQAAPGQDAYTNGDVIFVPAADSGSSAGRCWSRPRCSARAAWIGGW